MNERNLIPEAIEYLSKSDEERILYCKKDHWIGYGVAVKLIEILEDKFLDPPQMRHEGLLIYGDSNNGKTAILKRMYELHKTKLDYVTKDGEAIYEIPIIYFQAPTIPDENRLYNLILDELCVAKHRNDKVVIKANEFGVWFWEDFYNIDAKKISKPVDFSKYTNVYEDFKGKIMTLHQNNK